jgi:hypothetical protein
VEEKKLPHTLSATPGFLCLSPSIADGLECAAHDALRQGIECRYFTSEDEKRTWRLKVRSLSKRDPVPLGKDPHVDADWVVVCIRVRTDSPTARVKSIEPGEITHFRVAAISSSSVEAPHAGSIVMTNAVGAMY